MHERLGFLAKALDAPGEQLLLLAVARLDRDTVRGAAREAIG